MEHVVTSGFIGAGMGFLIALFMTLESRDGVWPIFWIITIWAGFIVGALIGALEWWVRYLTA